MRRRERVLVHNPLVSVRFFLPAIVLVVLAAAGCGGGGGTTSSAGSTSTGVAPAVRLQPADVVVVAGKHISKAQLDELLSEARSDYKVQGRAFPKPGTSAFSSIESQAVTFLLQQAETEAEAGKLGITVTDKDVDQQIQSIKQRCCQGSESKYRAALKQQGLTDTEVRDNARSQLYGQRLSARITNGVTVTPAAIAAYYRRHAQDFRTAPGRAVRYILLGKNQASLAAKLLNQLTGAPRSTWCKLAKKYSQDPSSSGHCGEASFTKGQTVPEFDNLLFSLPTGKAGKVNSSQYGWFVLEPTADANPVKTTSLAKATKKIRSTLLKSEKEAAITAWTTKTQKAYCKTGVIAYRAGYRPSPDPCAKSGTSTTTP
jgi:parvulin-like peptidyl-prolyl isomerase